MVEKLPFVLSDYKPYPTLDVLGTPLAMARATAHANRHQLAPMRYDTLGHRELMPDRELATPEEWPAALPGVDRLRIEATERADQRAQDEAQHREPESGKKTSRRGSTRSWRGLTS
jgi:hypothetical protein